MLKWLQFIGSTGYLKVKSRGMQVVVSLDSTKVTRVVGIPFHICSLNACQQKLILSMCCLNKTKTALNQSVIITFTF